MVRETLANAARDWMAARAEDLLPAEYFHLVFTLPAEIAGIALRNKRAICGLLFKASAGSVTTIAAGPKRLGAQVGIASVLHTSGSALTHHPHIHMIVPGGGLSLHRTKWIACRPAFFLHVRVLSRLFRRLFLEGLMELHRAGQLAFFGDLKGLADMKAFAGYLVPLRRTEWVIYAKPPVGGPEAVLVYLSRYAHRVAISNSRLISADAETVAFRWKDYRIKRGDRMRVMQLATTEFIRRFLMHVLPPSRQIASQSPAGHWTASTASATTVCWPARTARPTSRRSGFCSGHRDQNRLTIPHPGPRRPRSSCANVVPAVAGRCASSGPSSAARSQCPEHHQGTRPHDTMPAHPS